MQESLNPISAMIFTSDFVLVIVNVSLLIAFDPSRANLLYAPKNWLQVYCILCVVSQFQELNRNLSLEGVGWCQTKQNLLNYAIHHLIHLIQQIEGLAVTGDFDTNHSNQPPMEEIKLCEVVEGGDLRHQRPQLGKALKVLINNKKYQRNMRVWGIQSKCRCLGTDENPWKSGVN